MRAHPLLEEARQRGNPLIEGTTVTFVWEGKTAPQLMDDLHRWAEHPQRLTPSAPGVWSTSFDLPQDAYLEYAFYDPRAKKSRRDPLNRKTVSNGFGGRNHFFYMPGAGGPTPLTKLLPNRMKGRVTRHTIGAHEFTASEKRRVYLYEPPTEEAVPLLVVYDGLDYFRHAHLAEIVDNLITQKRIRPLAVAFLNNGGDRARSVEYGCSEATLVFVARDVIGLAGQHLNLLDIDENPGSYGVMGASLGGLMAVFTAMRLPRLFGKALSQAGAFELWEPVGESIAMQMARHLPKLSAKIWMDCGRMDALLEGNRKMHAILKKKGVDVTYVESGGSHNYTTWHDSLWRGLETLFPL